MAQELPNLVVAPVDDGMDAHERRPAVIGGVEMGQQRAVRVGAARADENGLDVGLQGEVVGEGGAHGGADEGGEGEVVVVRGGGDEGVDGGEGVRRHDVDGLEGGREGWMCVQGSEVENEEDEAVFAAVVG